MFFNAKGQFYLSVKDRSTIKKNYSLKTIPSKDSNFFWFFPLIGVIFGIENKKKKGMY